MEKNALVSFINQALASITALEANGFTKEQATALVCRSAETTFGLPAVAERVFPSQFIRLTNLSDQVSLLFCVREIRCITLDSDLNTVVIAHDHARYTVAESYDTVEQILTAAGVVLA